LPTSRRRPPFPRRPEQSAATLVKVGFGESERLLAAQPRSPQHHNQTAKPAAMRPVAGPAHDGDYLLHLRRIGG